VKRESNVPRTLPQPEHLKPLGRHRLRIFSCLGGDVSHLPQYKPIGPDEDAFDAFRSFVRQLIARSSATPLDPLTKSLLAAGRLLIGEIDAADEILDALPQVPFARDHGMGHCLIAAVEILAAVVPLPAAAMPPAMWCAGSAEQAEAKAWLASHRDRLVWRELDCEYALR
jgi:hypothetical protein